MAGTRQRHDGVQFLGGAFDDQFATRRIVAGALLAARRLWDDVRAVERIVKAAPAGVGGIEREAGIHHRHHQLRTRCGRDLRIDVGGVDLEGLAFACQIADVGEKRLVGGRIVGFAAPLQMPSVDLRLQLVPLGEELAVGGR